MANRRQGTSRDLAACQGQRDLAAVHASTPSAPAPAKASEAAGEKRMRLFPALNRVGACAATSACVFAPSDWGHSSRYGAVP
jgi:hypothetical protein